MRSGPSCSKRATQRPPSQPHSPAASRACQRHAGVLRWPASRGAPRRWCASRSQLNSSYIAIAITLIATSPAKASGMRCWLPARLDQVADAGVARRHLRQHRADEGQRDRDLQRAVEVRHGARQAHLDQHVPALGAQHAQHVLQLGLQRGQAGGDVHHDREERDQERGEDARPDADAEPHHQDRHDGRLGHGVEAHHQRVDRGVGQRARSRSGTRAARPPRSPGRSPPS